MQLEKRLIFVHVPLYYNIVHNVKVRRVIFELNKFKEKLQEIHSIHEKKDLKFFIKRNII